jgi:carbon-monoxide dehydrogenase iron sulfur subunit
MNERMTLAIDDERCTGCNTCMLVCSFVHEKVFNYERSRIRVWRDDDKGDFIPVTCEQCEDAPCVLICPTEALFKDEAGLVRRDPLRCIGCNECMLACPIGAISRFDGMWRKCDLCASLGGIPYCAANCTAEALRYLPVRVVAKEKAEKTAKRRLQSSERGA